MVDLSEVDSSARDRQNHQAIGSSNYVGQSNPGSSLGLGLGRQSSIYSLTLDEFQNTICESGKNFGSMNMDEFLNSIWTAEENQAQAANTQGEGQQQVTHCHIHQQDSNLVNSIEKQPSLSTLPRQGSLSLSLPAPLCRKTVEEVWSEIQHPSHDHQTQRVVNGNGNGSGTHERQATFGEMTLEDFLVKAGVVRENSQCGPVLTQPPVVAVAPPQPQQPFGFAFGNPQMGTGLGPSFVNRPMLPAAYQTQGTANGADQPPGYGPRPGPKRNNNNGYPTVACYGGSRVNNNGGGAGLSPVSPVSSDGLCGTGQGDNSGAGTGRGGQYGMELGGLRSTSGRKRIIDGPVEKVVERRQRRMIKNRESAARSRARKQAYTVELEAELNQLREENALLKQAMTEMEEQRKQQFVEEKKMVGQSRAHRAQERLMTMRRSRSCNL